MPHVPGTCAIAVHGGSRARQGNRLLADQFVTWGSSPRERCLHPRIVCRGLRADPVVRLRRRPWKGLLLPEGKWMASRTGTKIPGLPNYG